MIQPIFNIDLKNKWVMEIMHFTYIVAFHHHLWHLTVLIIVLIN